jgi:hypothetical protein
LLLVTVVRGDTESPDETFFLTSQLTVCPVTSWPDWASRTVAVMETADEHDTAPDGPSSVTLYGFWFT